MSRLTGRSRNASLAALMRELPLAAMLPLFVAIFAVFGLLGLVIDLMSGGATPPAVVLRNMLLSGSIAMAYFFGLMRRNWWLLGAAVVGQLVWLVAAPGPGPAPRAAATHLDADAIGVLVLMIVSYTSFLSFINGTASRYLRVRAEIDLAHEIHQVLVPPIASLIGGVEFAGISAASGEVGGDLVDVVQLGAGWFGYVADVSGHGVSSGVVMGMFKSALRMRLRQGGTLSALLDDLNAVLIPLKSSAMYVTAACVRGADDGTLEYAVAGHLPILRVRADGSVDELTTPQLALGMFEDRRFVSAPLELGPGELLALLTDGLTEVFDASDRELGLDAIKAVLTASGNRPLGEVADAIVAKARTHGKQLDDQTLLLVRRR
jgi:serine phosphatase RsbU (regulator of sigma subunit)